MDGVDITELCNDNPTPDFYITESGSLPEAAIGSAPTTMVGIVQQMAKTTPWCICSIVPGCGHHDIINRYHDHCMVTLGSDVQIENVLGDRVKTRCCALAPLLCVRWDNVPGSTGGRFACIYVVLFTIRYITGCTKRHNCHTGWHRIPIHGISCYNWLCEANVGGDVETNNCDVLAMPGINVIELANRGLGMDGLQC